MSVRASGLRWTVNRTTRLRLLVSGLRWRARSSLVMLTVAVFAAGVAAFGPIYLHSADQVVLTRTLNLAHTATSGLELRPGTGHHSLAWLRRFTRTVPEPAGATSWWRAPIYTESAGFYTVPAGGAPASAAAATQLTSSTSTSNGTASPPARLLRLPREPYRGTRPWLGSLVARTGMCGHLHIVQGTCASARGVVVSLADSQTLGAGVGGTVEVVFGKTGKLVSMPIVGIYEPEHAFSPYWWDYNYFVYGSPSPVTGITDLDAAFATFHTVATTAPLDKISPLAQIPYRHGSLNVNTVGALRERLSAFQARALRGPGVRVSTRFFQILGSAAAIEHSAATVVDVVDIELALLGIFALYFVASRTAAEREPDVRLAELRGFRMRSTIAVALAEPVAVVAAAVPLGLLVAWAVAGAVAPSVFGPGVGVSLTPLALLAAIVAGVVGVGAAAIGARRSLAGSLTVTADAAAAASGTTRWSFLADAAWVALAGAAFFELVVGGDSGAGPTGSDPIAALSPGLLAIALGVLTARVLPRVLAPAHRRTAFSRKIATAFATRTVARRAEYRTELVLVALSFALATFAVSGWVISARNRDARATLGVGASKVLDVSVRTGTTLVRAVRRANPTGRYAMAAVVEQANDGTTLALDAPRLAAVATWPQVLGMSPAVVGRRLLPKLASQLLVTGSAISVSADVTSSLPATGRPELAANLYDIDSQFSTRIKLGRLHPGAHSYAARLFAYCPGGCRLSSLSVTWPTTTNPHPPTVAMDITRIAQRNGSGAWAALPAGLGNLHRWASPSGRVHLSSAEAGTALRVQFSLNDFGTVTIAPADVPKSLPVLVTPTSRSTASGVGGPFVVGLNGSTLPGHTIGQVPALPGVGNHAVVVDLPLAERFLTQGFRTTTAEVWLAKDAPPSIVTALGRRGVRVVREATGAQAIAALVRSGLNLAYLLYLLAAAASAVLVIGATAFMLTSAARRRQSELSALRAVGVDPAALRRAVWAEQGIVLGTGVVVGVLAGAVAAAVALRSVPEFVVKAPGLPLQLGLPVVDLVVAVGAVVLALALTVVAGTSAMVRGATIDRLVGSRI